MAHLMLATPRCAIAHHGKANTDVSVGDQVVANIFNSGAPTSPLITVHASVACRIETDCR